MRDPGDAGSGLFDLYATWGRKLNLPNQFLRIVLALGYTWPQLRFQGRFSGHQGPVRSKSCWEFSTINEIESHAFPTTRRTTLQLIVCSASRAIIDVTPRCLGKFLFAGRSSRHLLCQHYIRGSCRALAVKLVPTAIGTDRRRIATTASGLPQRQSHWLHCEVSQMY